jgi:hypothetical protein
MDVQVFERVAVEVTTSGDAEDEALHTHAHKYDDKTEKVKLL